ncbi:cleavage and polyadenylation specificity factor subunit 2-like [Mya arenaria]|uniref:cleavage and polyadenylation specificity factor subunit 2-like n=1 Tax=Mya arenaria TaxID=6604 RepID=UPI0022E24286|nr:cleavage and polyadenylation specificity factor subunit 2-like [Mya arenaria]
MTSIIRLQPLSGAEDESPPCYLLQVDEFRFLLDCGWDEDFSMPVMKEIKRHVHKVDAVLLTYPDLLHLGALPYLMGKCGLSCPVYATVPVYKMGQMFMYDLFQSRNNSENFNMFTLDDVDQAFDKIIQLKYSQTVNLPGKGFGLQITPLPAGHMLGGTIWKILKDGEEEIVYAVDYNHKKERHLNGCILEGKYFTRPHLMITDAFNANYNQSRRRVRDEQLMTTILQTMRRDGNVMVAVDTAGRMLELAQLLDQIWRNTESGLTTYSLALLNNVSFNVIEFAKSQVEWMSDKIMRAFEDHRTNPYHFKHLKLCHNLSELGKIPEPKVVLCSQPDLQSGFSRDLFVAWCGNPKNSIILTNRTSPRTLARWLIDHPDNKTVTMEVRRRIRLEGAELEEFMKKKHEAEEKEKKKAVQEPEESSDESDAEMEVDGAVPAPSTSRAKHDIIIKQEGKGRSGFFKQAKKSYPMFPYTEERMKWDEYGEIIRPEDYMISETTVSDETLSTEKLVAESDQLQDVSEVPTKCIAVTVTLDINASIQYIDFEGRTDGESMKKILSQIKPRQLVLIHGSEEATSSLAEYCRTTSGVVQGSVFTPSIGEVVDATTESHIYQVKLKDYLVSALEFSKARDAELAWIDGIINFTESRLDIETDIQEDDEEDAKLSIVRGREGLENVPILEAVPSNQISGHTAVFINEPKLSDFKVVLLQEGIQAEFSAGALVCNDTIAVRRNEAGRMQLEGAISRDYFKVRDLLYKQYAIV